MLVIQNNMTRLHYIRHTQSDVQAANKSHFLCIVSCESTYQTWSWEHLAQTWLWNSWVHYTSLFSHNLIVKFVNACRIDGGIYLVSSQNVSNLHGCACSYLNSSETSFVLLQFIKTQRSRYCLYSALCIV